MEQINNDTLQVILALIGPAGFGLLALGLALAYACRELWNELKVSREKHIISIDLNTKAMNDLSGLIRERL